MPNFAQVETASIKIEQPLFQTETTESTLLSNSSDQRVFLREKNNDPLSKEVLVEREDGGFDRFAFQAPEHLKSHPKATVIAVPQEGAKRIWVTSASQNDIEELKQLVKILIDNDKKQSKLLKKLASFHPNE